MADAVARVRSTRTQRLVLAKYLKNGGKKTDAYAEVFADKVAAWSKSKVATAAHNFFKTVTMQALMTEAEIETRVGMEKRAEAGLNTAIVQYGITKERIMAELAKIAFAQQTDVMSWGPDGVIVKDSKDIGDAAAAVGEVTASGGGESPLMMKIKLLDKRQALIDLGKEIGMFQQKVEVRGQVAVGAKFILEGK